MAPVVPRAFISSISEYAESVEAIDFRLKKARLLFRDGMSQTEAWFGFDELIFRRPTGLKDKNGMEIYEGDVITNHGVTNEMKQRRFSIIWVPERARFSARDEAANMNTGIDDWDMKSCEVIGNIYENPELLEKVTE